MYEAGNMYFLEARPNTVSKDRGGKGAVTLINAEKKGCGSRMIISKQLEKDLQLEDKIQIALDADGSSFFLSKCIDEKEAFYSLRRLKKGDSNSRLVLYQKAVIQELTEKLGLNFDEVVSVTFYGVKYFEEEGTRVARIFLEEK